MLPKFRELGVQSYYRVHNHLPNDPGNLIANRYVAQERLGRGSFGTVYLIEDTKTAIEDKLKVLKEIPVGDLKPTETVKVMQEARLLSQLQHPAILKFFTSFLERDVFCIITEYCEDGDLDCKMEEMRVAGKTLSEGQISEWLIQLLLGLNYMHQRRILHRDLKSKNVFLKKNVVKIGDFGVSCLLMGSCDLATTFTGTPYYMSPEALSHRGYDSKSDIWSLGCILHEMCCLKHAFEGHHFLCVVLKIVEGPTPSLPDHYSRDLNILMQRMLEKDPQCRLSAADALRFEFIQEFKQSVKHQLSDLTLRDQVPGDERDASQIARALQIKVHLQTLRERSEVEKMSPRERMRLRKQQAADERAKRLKQIVEDKYKENHHRMMELRSRHFHKVSANVLKEKSEITVCKIQPTTDQHITTISHLGQMENQLVDRLHVSDPAEHGIPEDPQTAEAYYSEEVFESFSDEDDFSGGLCGADNLCQTFAQDSDLEAMVQRMENVLEENPSTELERGMCQAGHQKVSSINITMAENRIQYIRDSACQRLGEQLFQRVYEYLKEARQRHESEDSIIAALGRLVERPADCFEVDQLLYYEEQLEAAQAIGK
ncbi:serine/threonine-protein kinase Nek11 [Electrophorus electricus]|uniref:serine/threonine-protein kinase Nek11 n=1 Tax=Electrophorus electricus TaxID=8005 RepID=UPI000F0A7869|nr:serine/threonine-protein kinase Nek11 [Electrophorus electricus]